MSRFTNPKHTENLYRMEQYDKELLSTLANNHYKLKKLYNEHVELEKQLERYKKHPAYTAQDYFQEKELKKRKLQGMDEIMSILQEFKKAA